MNYAQYDYSFWEEHVNYFTISTLKQLLSLHGFRIIFSETTWFTGQAIVLYCQKDLSIRSASHLDYDHIQRTRYISDFQIFKNHLFEHLLHIKADKPLALFGAGCRSLCLSSFFDLFQLFDVVVDDSEVKSNRWIPNSSLQILESSDISFNDYHVILGVNAEAEASVIKSKHLSTGSYFSILPPSKNLPDFWTTLLN